MLNREREKEEGKKPHCRDTEMDIKWDRKSTDEVKREEGREGGRGIEG